MNKGPTIKDVYRQASKLISELDARILIKHVLSLDETKFWRDLDLEIDSNDITKIDKLILRRAKNEPIAYILGHKEFYGLDFLVNKNVLIPRPESEWLVEKSLEILKGTKNKNILDIGTGSGNIIVSIAKNFPDANYFASDISNDAIIIAKKNARLHNIDNIKFIQSNLFDNIDSRIKFDLIIANLPYVPDSAQQTADGLQLKFEPADAIFAKDNGADIIKKFLVQAKDHTHFGSAILVELDPRNAEDLKNFAKKIFSDKKIELQKDLAKRDRYLIIS